MDTVEFLEDGPLLSQIGEGQRAVTNQRRKALGYFFAKTSVRLGILIAALGALYATFHLPQDTFAQSLLCNLAAGLLVFLAAAPLLRAVRRDQGIVLAAIILVAITLGGAYFSGAVLQSLLLNIGVGSALVLALDLNIARWLDAVARANSLSRERLKEAAARVAAAESALDYKYAVHDYLGLPRPDKFRGISLAEDEHLLPVVAFTESQAESTALGQKLFGAPQSG